jgi:hypothetical protein
MTAIVSSGQLGKSGGSESIEMREAAEVRRMEWLGTNECERLEVELGVWTIWTACNSQGLIQPESAT